MDASERLNVPFLAIFGIQISHSPTGEPQVAPAMVVAVAAPRKPLYTARPDDGAFLEVLGGEATLPGRDAMKLAACTILYLDYATVQETMRPSWPKVF